MIIKYLLDHMIGTAKFGDSWALSRYLESVLSNDNVTDRFHLLMLVDGLGRDEADAKEYIARNHGMIVGDIPDGSKYVAIDWDDSKAFGYFTRAGLLDYLMGEAVKQDLSTDEKEHIISCLDGRELKEISFKDKDIEVIHVP